MTKSVKSIWLTPPACFSLSKVRNVYDTDISPGREQAKPSPVMPRFAPCRRSGLIPVRAVIMLSCRVDVPAVPIMNMLAHTLDGNNQLSWEGRTIWDQGHPIMDNSAHDGRCWRSQQPFGAGKLGARSAKAQDSMPCPAENLRPWWIPYELPRPAALN